MYAIRSYYGGNSVVVVLGGSVVVVLGGNSVVVVVGGSVVRITSYNVCYTKLLR